VAHMIFHRGLSALHVLLFNRVRMSSVRSVM